jgi:predicted oxidoreductase
VDTDVIVVGAGLAGLAAAAEVADAGKRVVLVDQEPEQSLGGQAFWSLGGLFLVDTPEQRRMGIRDSRDLALQDWLGSAQFDREEDRWPRRWAEAYVDFAAGEKRAWLREMGHRLFPIVGWAERGDGRADGHGNSVPRFHLTWGTGPGVVAPFERRVREHAATASTRWWSRAAPSSACAAGCWSRAPSSAVGPAAGSRPATSSCAPRRSS